MHPEKKHRQTAARTITLLTILLAFLCYSCDSKTKKFEENYTFYRAVNGKDTALLAIAENKTHFYGRYEIQYEGTMKDSGEVRGKIMGDTLQGDYYYKPYGGGKWKRVPIALLKKDRKLLLGRGVTITYMNIPRYTSGVPIEYSDPKFTFETIQKAAQK